MAEERPEIRPEAIHQEINQEPLGGPVVTLTELREEMGLEIGGPISIEKIPQSDIGALIEERANRVIVGMGEEDKMGFLIPRNESPDGEKILALFGKENPEKVESIEQELAELQGAKKRLERSLNLPPWLEPHVRRQREREQAGTRGIIKSLEIAVAKKQRELLGAWGFNGVCSATQVRRENKSISPSIQPDFSRIPTVEDRDIDIGSRGQKGPSTTAKAFSIGAAVGTALGGVSPALPPPHPAEVRIVQNPQIMADESRCLVVRITPKELEALGQGEKPQQGGQPQQGEQPQPGPETTPPTLPGGGVELIDPSKAEIKEGTRLKAVVEEEKATTSLVVLWATEEGAEGPMIRNLEADEEVQVKELVGPYSKVVTETGEEGYVFSQGDYDTTKLMVVVLTEPAAGQPGEEPGKVEPIKIDQEKFEIDQPVNDGVICIDVDDPTHQVRTKGDVVRVSREAKIENGQVFLKAVAKHPDGREVTIWVPAKEFNDEGLQLASLAGTTKKVLEASGFSVIEIGPRGPVSPEEWRNWKPPAELGLTPTDIGERPRREAPSLGPKGLFQYVPFQSDRSSINGWVEGVLVNPKNIAEVVLVLGNATGGIDPSNPPLSVYIPNLNTLEIQDRWGPNKTGQLTAANIQPGDHLLVAIWGIPEEINEKVKGEWNWTIENPIWIKIW